MKKAITSLILLTSLFSFSNLYTSAYPSDRPVLRVNPIPVFEGAGKKAEVIDGEPGTIIEKGDLIFKILSNDTQIPEYDDDSITKSSENSATLSGDTMSDLFDLTEDMGWFKVWIKNEGTNDIVFTITRDSPSGSLLEGSNIKIGKNKTIEVYNNKALSKGAYYINYTSGKSDMSGSTACKVASTQAELDA